jgi:hypothetical protein
MQTRGSDAISYILAREQARLEETKRMNDEREILLALLPDTWKEFTEPFRDGCARLNQLSPTIELECSDPDERTFLVSRIHAGNGIPALEFVLDPRVPRIVITDHWNDPAESRIDLILVGRKIAFVRGGSRSGIIVPDLAGRLLKQITRP